MNDLVPVTENSARLVAAPHPFTTQTIDRFVPEGLTLLQMLELAQPDPILARHAHIFINDIYIPKDRWHLVKPKKGTTISIRVVPHGGGGGKSPLRIILMIAVIAMSFYLGPILGAALGGIQVSAAATTMAFGSVSYAALGTAIVGMAGSLLINAIAPVRPPKLNNPSTGSNQDSPTSFIQGGRNQANLFGNVPRTFGEDRVVPLLGSRTFSELQGDDQYLRMLVVWGYGPVELSGLRIGDTDLADYDDVEIEHRGIIGKCVELNGASYFEGESYQLGATFTIEAFVNGAIGPIVSTRNSTAGNGTAVWIDDDGHVVLVDDTATPSTITSAGTVNDGEWHHVFVAVSGSVATILIDRTVDTVADFNFRSLGSHAIQFGNDAAGGLITTTTYEGKLDDVRVWSVARTNDQAMMPIKGTENGLIFWLGFDDSDGRDYTANERDITFHNGSPGAVFSTGIAAMYHRHKLFADDPAEDTFSVLLNQADGYTTRTTEADADEIIAEFTFPQGLCQFDDSGNKLNATVSVTFEYSVKDANNWSGQTLEVSARTTAAIRKAFRFNVDRNQYDVRMKRNTADHDSDKIFDKVYFTAVRTFTRRDPIAQAGWASTAIRIRANDQLNGMVDTFNGIVRALMRSYDPVDGVWRWNQFTANPADHYREVMQGFANKRRLPDSRLNLTELESWWVDNDDAGREFNYTYGERSSVPEVLNDICSAGRAAKSINNGRWGVIVDKVRTLPKQHFTPRNSWSFNGQKMYPVLPHGFRVRFRNRFKDWAEDERIVYADGYDATNATLFETLEFPGVTDPDQIWKAGRYNTAVMLLRPELYNFYADAEHLVCTKGDLIVVGHDVTLWGLATGRVKSVADDGASPPQATTVTLDQICPMEIGKTYNIRFRLSNGDTLVKTVNTVPGESATLQFETPFDLSEAPEPGDLAMFGETGNEVQELLVLNIENGDDLSAHLTCLDYSPDIYNADEGTIPPFNSGITDPIGLNVPAVQEIRSDDFVLLKQSDGALIVRILITLIRSTGTFNDIRGVEIAYKPSGSDSNFILVPEQVPDNGSVSIAGVDQGEQYDIQLRYVMKSGAKGEWSNSFTHTVIGKVNPPPDVDTFVVDRLADGTRRFRFGILSGPVPLDLAGYRIRYADEFPSPLPDWDDLTPLHGSDEEPQGLLLTSPWETNELPAGAYTFAIKAVDTSGNESVNMTIIEAELGDPRLLGALINRIERSLGWPGTRTNCFRDSDGILKATGGDWDSLAGTTWDDLAGKTWETITARETEISYETPVIDLGANITATPLIDFAGNGVLTLQMATGADGESPVVGAYGDVGQIVQKRYMQFKITAADGTIPQISRLNIIVDGQSATAEINDVNTASETALYFESIAAGHFKISDPGNKIAVITQAKIVALQNVGPGWGWELIAKDGTVNSAPAAEFKIYNNSGTLADATVDIELRGPKRS